MKGNDKLVFDARVDTSTLGTSGQLGVEFTSHYFELHFLLVDLLRWLMTINIQTQGLESCLVAACARTSSEKSWMLCMRVGGTRYQIQPEAIFIFFVCSNSSSARSLSGHPFHFNCPYLLNISHYYLNILCMKLFIAAQEHQTNAKWLMLGNDFTK